MTPSPTDVRTAAEVADRHALRSRHDATNLLEHAPPPAVDVAAYRHNVDVAHGHLQVSIGWAEIAQAHREYADELEQGQRRASARIADELQQDAGAA